MRSTKRSKGMMRYYDIEDAIEDIRRSKALARAFETENAAAYIQHLDNLEAAYLKELRKRKKPEGPEHRKSQEIDHRRRWPIGKFI